MERDEALELIEKAVSTQKEVVNDFISYIKEFNDRVGDKGAMLDLGDCRVDKQEEHKKELEEALCLFSLWHEDQILRRIIDFLDEQSERSGEDAYNVDGFTCYGDLIYDIKTVVKNGTD